MAGPAAVVVAAIVTAWLAIASNDGLVADDYYKQGLAINQVLAREERARALGLTATIRLESEAIELAMQSAGAALPERLLVSLTHATRAGLDRSAWLQRSGAGYRGVMAPAQPGRWRIALEDEARTWRMTGAALLPQQSTIRIYADAAGTSR